jgi:hypothetical protein
LGEVGGPVFVVGVDAGLLLFGLRAFCSGCSLYHYQPLCVAALHFTGCALALGTVFVAVGVDAGLLLFELPRVLF